MQTCTTCASEIDDRTDDNFSADHAFIHCFACGAWQTAACEPMMDLSDPQMGELVSTRVIYSDNHGDIGDGPSGSHESLTFIKEGMNAQEKLWSGPFGDEYSARNVGRVESNTFFFARILRHINIKSYIEFGAGTGENIAAMQRLFSGAKAYAVEINEAAAAKIDPTVRVYRQSMLDCTPVMGCDLSFTKGALIHIHPDDISVAYQALYEASKRYILTAEYYNPTPVEVEYRGEFGRMWKRDHAGEMMDLYPDLWLVDYGFAWNRGPWPQDSLTWFLMEKR